MSIHGNSSAASDVYKGQGVMKTIGRRGERARLERENLRALREQREKEKSNNTIRLDPNMGY